MRIDEELANAYRRINLSCDKSHTLVLDEKKIAEEYAHLQALEKEECKEQFLDELNEYEKELKKL